MLTVALCGEIEWKICYNTPNESEAQTHDKNTIHLPWEYLSRG